MSRRRQESRRVQEVAPRRGSDVAAGKVSPSASRIRSSKRKSRSYVILPFGVRVIRKSWYWGLVTVALVFVLLGALLVYSIRQYAAQVSEHVGEVDIDGDREVGAQVLTALGDDSSGDESAGADLLLEKETEEVPLSLETILGKYRSVSGLSEVQGVILHGQYTEDGREFTMKLLAKAPGLVRKNLADDTLKMICRYDGAAATVEIEDPEGEMRSQPLADVLYQRAIILEGAVLSLGSDKLPDVLVYQWEPNQEYEGHTCWTIRRRISTGLSMIHLIDSETGFERVRFVSFMHEGQRQQLSLHLSDYRQLEQGTLPFAYALKLNGELRGEARLDSIQLNPGLMPWMF